MARKNPDLSEWSIEQMIESIGVPIGLTKSQVFDYCELFRQEGQEGIRENPYQLFLRGFRLGLERLGKLERKDCSSYFAHGIRGDGNLLDFISKYDRELLFKGIEVSLLDHMAMILHDMDMVMKLGPLRSKLSRLFKGFRYQGYVGGEIGEEVWQRVRAVTSIKNAGDRCQLSVNRLYDEAIDRPSVLVIKLAEVLDNARTINYLEPAAARERLADMVICVYCSIAAEDLGLEAVSTDLEDLATPFYKGPKANLDLMQDFYE